MALFAAFGSVTMLLFDQFGGGRRQRQLPAAIPAPISMAPDRLLGWLLAGGATLAAAALVPLGPPAGPLAGAAAAALRELAAHIASDLPPGGHGALPGLAVLAADGLGVQHGF